MKHIYFLLLACLSLHAFSQTPQGISYQGVLRNLDGSIISGTNITITFRIHDNTPDGIVVYEENHSTTTSSNGLVNLTVGMGTAVNGVFSEIAWGAGNKHLQVLMNNGSGEIDLGTQQMMSVPYALHADDISINVSSTGDTLTLGSSSVIVPGISNSTNGTNYLYTQGAGVTDIDGNFYPSVIINGKEWMAENLKVTKFNNGTPINYSYNWSSGSGAYTYYNNDVVNRDVYGCLYSAFCINDIYANPEQSNLCPVGWRLPRKLDFVHLLCSLDDSLFMIGSHDYIFSIRDEYLLDTTQFDSTHSEFGFGLKLGGYVKSNDPFFSPLSQTYLWSSDILNVPFSGPLRIALCINDQSLSYSGQPVVIGPISGQFSPGLYVRCVKDN
jgi:uncharacterized protein (TIGR02145 family)